MCSAKDLDKINAEFKNYSIPQELNVSKVQHAVEEDLNEADEEDEDECEEYDEMPGYSEETNMDTVEDMANIALFPKKKTITRTSSVVQNFQRSHDSVDYNNSFDHSKSLTHIERERENALQLSRLKKSHRHGAKYQQK